MSLFESELFNDLQDILSHELSDMSCTELAELPSAESLNSKFSQLNSNQKKLNFSCQNQELPYQELGYEERIYKYGIIAHRENNWHDFFNALIWKKFPKTKIVLNEIHYQELQLQSTNHRSKKRDILTLFDECGVVIQANESIFELIRNHQWKSLFIENKNLWLSDKIKISTFGHAMYEKYLNAYIGMTAKALLVPLNIENLDQYLSSNIREKTLLDTKSKLHPLPVLGIPNWYKNQNEKFYENTKYFR